MTREADSRYRSQMVRVVRATAFVGATVFAWFGKRPPRLPRRLSRALPPAIQRRYLTRELAEHLYSYFYCKGFAAPMHWEAPAPAATGDLVGALRRANVGGGHWSTGWLRTSRTGTVPDGTAVIAKDGASFSVLSQTLLRERPPAWDLRLPKDLPGRSPGYYLAMSDTPFPDSTPVVRLYWNCTAAGSIRLMHALTHALNADGIPFLFKVLDDPAAFNRCDTAVLYLPEPMYADIDNTLAAVYRDAAAGLRAPVPALTKRLAPGLGLAEDTDDGRSFGMHRSRILAECLVAVRDRRLPRAERGEAVVRRIAENGVDPRHPYLRPGSTDTYRELPKTSRLLPSAAPIRLSGLQPADTLITGRQLTRTRLIDLAREVGTILVDAAVWHDTECTWLGSVVPTGDGRVYAVLGPDLYSGTAGVARFLGELHEVVAEERLRRTATAALRRAFRDLSEIAPERRIGLYDGWVGIATTAIRLGHTTGDEELVAAARNTLRDALDAPSPELDLISGAAGAVCGALEFARLSGEYWPVEQAMLIGDRLVSAAIPVGTGCSWRTINRGPDYHLTGLSHGTAGIAYSLLALYAATEDRRYLDLAESGFAYERDWFDPVEQNWPDLRETRASRGSDRSALAFSTYWCHGAPGIALSRLLAFEVTDDPVYRLEALAAAKTTLRFTLESLGGPTSCALCHGLLGNAAVLSLVARALPEFDAGETAALRIGRAVDSLGPVRTLPLGTPAWSPGLMLGLAGVGHAALLLAGQVTDTPLYPAASIAPRDRRLKPPICTIPAHRKDPTCPEPRLISPSWT